MKTDIMNGSLAAQDKIIEVFSRMTPQWLAGFFDGDGCVYAEVTKYNNPYVIASISQVEPTILALIGMRYDGVLGESPRKGFKPSHRIGWYGVKAQPFLEIIKDHVICKRRQVELGLELFTDVSVKRAVEISRELSALKKGTLMDNQFGSKEGVL